MSQNEIIKAFNSNPGPQQYAVGKLREDMFVVYSLGWQAAKENEPMIPELMNALAYARSKIANEVAIAFIDRVLVKAREQL